MSFATGEPINVTIDETRYWEGMSRQDMDFQQALGELVDNAVSGSGKSAEGEQLPFRIEIMLERTNGLVRLWVSDEGRGITRDDLRDRVFAIGGEPRDPGPLNEHGFGLKNALCVLTGNHRAWSIVSCDQSAAAAGETLRVDGPFCSDMVIQTTGEALFGHTTQLSNTTGTAVYAETTFEYFGTLYRRATSWETLIVRLQEHLGVIYRGFLSERFNKMWLTYRDQGCEWLTLQIAPLPIPYQTGEYTSTTLTVNGPNGPAAAEYRRGLLDADAVRQPSPSPFPMRMYYQKDQKTQGIDIVLRGRVVKTAQFTEIWSLDRHNDYNEFVGELCLNDDNFKTVNNKTGLDPHDPYWIALLEELRTNSDFKPQKVVRRHEESDIKKEIARVLKNLMGGDPQREYPIWSGCAVKIDIYHKAGNGELYVYEVKKGTAGPLDAYQLLMYWDGVVKDESVSPVCGRLIAKECPQSVLRLIEDLNQRTDSRGQQYRFEFKRLTDIIPDLRT